MDLKELENTQYIDQSKIYCDNCHTCKNEINDFKFFVCNKCKINLCPSCNESHDKTHKKYRITKKIGFYAKNILVNFRHIALIVKKIYAPYV